jgi:beta-galactosidase
MPKIEIREKKVVVGSKKIPLISGEVHYWRLNPSYWKAILERVREMGLNIVSTYIPWDYHEYKRGSFDFTGQTHDTRNLKRFLEITREEGFWVIIRPGPYIYSEWPNEGAPPYAYKYHRLHPKFLEYAQEYMRRVTAVLKPFFATRKGGHIILFQADNEIDPWPDIFGDQYGLGTKPGMFQEFLRNKYHDRIGELNENWGTHYKRFEEAGPFIACMLANHRGLPLKGDRELRRNLDYFEFKYYYSLECAKWCVNAYKKLGVDIPIYLNLYPFFYVQDWAEMQKASDMVGIDLYPSSELSEDEHEQRKMIDKVRYTRTFSKLPYIAEFAAGVWHARHYESGVLTPNHYRLITLTALLGGITGWNWYMLVNRDNWYMSPINEWGRVRFELYRVFRELVQIYKAIDPPSLEKLCEVSVTFNPLQHAARTISQEGSIGAALHDADIDYELYDPKLGNVKKKILFYSGNQWLDREAQNHLLRYVREGGILVAFRDYPRKDENFRDCNVLAFQDPSRTLFEFKKCFTIDLGRKHSAEIVSSIYAFDRVEGRKIQAEISGYGKVTVGYLKTCGKGTILHLGVEPNKALIFAILRFFRVPLYVNSPTKDVKTALFKRGKKYCLIAVNNGMEDKSATILFPDLDFSGKRYRVREIASRRNELFISARVSTLSVELPRKDGKVFELSRA